MQILGVAVCLIFLTQLFDCSFACNGYDVELLSFESISGNPALCVAPNPQIDLTDKCVLHVYGTLDILRPVRSAELNFNAKQGKLVFLEGRNIDLCDLLAESSNLPYQCPFQPAQYTADGQFSIDLSQYKGFLGSAVGDIYVSADVITNNTEHNKFRLKLRVTPQN